MTEQSPGDRAVAACEVNDIFLVNAQCNVLRDYNPAARIKPFAYQHRVEPESTGICQVRQIEGSAEEIYVIRYFIHCGLRVLKPEVEAGKADPTTDDLLAEITATLAVDYTCPKALTKDTEALGAFTANAVFHAWPYWREMIHSTLARMRLPSITLPMMKPNRTVSATTAESASSRSADS